MTIEITENDIACAHKNWLDWQDVFEFRGAPEQSPLLIERDRFKRFLKEYSVGRTIRRGMSDALRAELSSGQSGLREMLADESGVALDDFEHRLSSRYSSKERGSLTSLISKIAAFLAPEQFIAWDRFARRGVNKSRGSPVSTRFQSYAEYLRAVEGLEEEWRAVVAACDGRWPSPWSSGDDRFSLRVLDVYLMRIGGRRTIPSLA